MVSVVIPAFNEETTIGGVVAVARTHPDVAEVLVVDDASTDATISCAQRAGARVVSLPKNGGKAGAMEYGVLQCREDVILFLDGDLVGLTHETMSKTIRPVSAGEREMCVAINSRKWFWMNRILHFLAIIGGTRAVTRRLWSSIPHTYKKRFQIEIAMNYFSKKFPRGMDFFVAAAGTHHVTKEKKHGMLRGFFNRLYMIYDILEISVRLYIIQNFREFFVAKRTERASF
jgi:glycosyltransferase involved in cell wall biosynthesis